jgi:ATP-dependent RNA helicase HelY
LSTTDFATAVDVLGSVRLGKNVNHRSPQERRDIVSRLRALDLEPEVGRRAHAPTDPADDVELVRLRRALRAHPCHACPDREEHARWAERHARLSRENAKLRARIEGRTGSLGRTFDRICALLENRGYLDGDTVPASGRRLARIWSEADLVVAECVQHDAWAGLGAAELAAVVSSIVYEPRREEMSVHPAPTDAIARALERTDDIWADLADDEDRAGLPRSREPQRGFVVAAYRWAQGRSLDAVLNSAATRGEAMPAGDFIRWCKQLLDLLDQLAGAPAGVPADAGSVGAAELARTARAAADAIRRGVVAQSMGP